MSSFRRSAPRSARAVQPRILRGIQDAVRGTEPGDPVYEFVYEGLCNRYLMVIHDDVLIFGPTKWPEEFQLKGAELFAHGWSEKSRR
jgi:hypothetical protein